MKIKITTLCLILAFQSSFAQNDEISDKANQFFDPLKNRNHWGVNTQFVFDRLFESRTTPIEIIYKRQKTEKKANRLGVQLYYDHSDERPYTSSPDWNTIDTQIILGLYFGKEWQNFIGESQRWQWYYGVDINPAFTYNRQYINDGDLSDLREYDDFRFYKYSISIRPFLGLRFEITERLYVSTEMFIDARYTYEEVNAELKQAPGVTPEFNRYSSYSNYSSLKYYPLNRLSVFFKL